MYITLNHPRVTEGYDTTTVTVGFVINESEGSRRRELCNIGKKNRGDWLASQRA